MPKPLTGKEKEFFSEKEKDYLANSLKIKFVKAGTRIFDDEDDKLDCLNFVLAGKTGIFNQDMLIIS